MNRLFLAACVVLGLIPNLSSAVVIDNIRPCWGPFGATRYDATCLPGDVLFISYDIDGLTIDPKTKKASYDTILELLDSKEKVIFSNTNSSEVIPALGGARMPGDLHVIMGPKQAAGDYKIRLTIKDKFDKTDKGRTAFVYKFEVLKEKFGFVGVMAPAIGLPGQHHVPHFALVNLGLDAKGNPDAELTIRILDEKQKEVAEPAKMVMPRDIPAGTDLKMANVVNLSYPIYLNRVGRYTIEVYANDKISKTKAKLSYPLTVLDVGKIADK